MIKEKLKIEFDGLNEWIQQAVEKGDPKGSSRSTSHNSWAGGSFEEVVKLGREGWPEGYAAIKAATAALFARVCTKLPLPETQFHEVPTSGVIDMGRLMEGDPECWIEQVTTEMVTDGPSHKTCRIVVNVSASCVVPTHVIFTRGAAIVALAEALEMMGRQVEISVTSVVSPSGWGGEGYEKKRTEIRAVVKPFHARSNWDVLSFALAHPGMLRRLVFAANEMFDGDVRKAFGFTPSGGYGCPANETPDPGDLYLPSAHAYETQWKSADAAEAWVIEELKRQGVQIEERS